MANAVLTRNAATSCQRLQSMTPDSRRAAYEAGDLTVAELNYWAAHYLEEVPLVNDELPWIALSLADLD